MRRTILFTWFLLTLAACPVDPASSCTLWTAIGSDEQAGRVAFLAKNRDWTPDHRQELRLVRSDKGHDYLGLLAVGGAEPGLKAGINRQGLSIVSASASSIPRRQRAIAPGERGLMRRLLASCASVDELRQAGHLFARARPMFLLAADSRQALVVEIGRNGEYRLDAPHGEFSAHTNHFLNPELAGNNSRIGSSSKQRLATITRLLSSAPRPMSLADMVAMSEDRTHGPDNSLLRTGTHTSDERTLATWIVALPVHGAPVLYVKLRNPGDEERAATFHLDQAFWESAAISGIASSSGRAITD